jgi:cell division septation protein DedD
MAVGAIAVVALAALFLGGTTARVSAQVASNDDRAAALPSTNDKTGTNPLNIQTTVVVVNDFRSLPDALFENTSRYRYVS